jgi:glutamate dehydrogenase
MSSVRTTEPSTTHADASELLNALSAEFRATAASVVPWFLDNMPPMYFQDTSAEDQRSHLRSILAARTSGRPLDVVIKGTDGQSITAIRAGNRPGVLAEIVATLPLDASLRSAKIHSSRDGSLVIDTFEFGDRELFDRADPVQAAKAEEALRYAREQAPSVSEPALRRFLDGCTAAYVSTLTALRLTRHYEQFARVSGTDAACVDLESERDPTTSRITIAVSNARTRTMLERAARVLTRHGVSITRAHLDLVLDPPHGSVTFLGFVVQSDKQSALLATDPQWPALRHELERIKWLDFRVVETLSREPELSMAQCEALLAFGDLVRAMLVPTNPLAFSRDRVVGALLARRAISCAALDLFAKRFDPASKLSDADFEAGLARLKGAIDGLNESDDVATILHALLRAVAAVRRTNFFVAKRFSFAVRLDAALMHGPTRPEIPYGLYFVHGRGFHGFHVRFKEIARGGLRVVKPSSAALYERESERLYDEAYGLAFAQQLKNKDIPEGGAKAAIILEPPAETNRSVKAFVDGILDLITPEETTRSRVVDRLGSSEFIFLGPDENITPDHIEWIVAHAHVRGYPLANAFMSSKPDGGINHKEYGVTSEGVNVFLRIALSAQGIDPTKRPFTVTITGGPDGDVAGNMMRILDRDYGANARILGVADGSGVGEDPAGLDHAELSRLFEAGLPIAAFDPTKLSPRGRIVKADHPEGIQLRNTLHNRIKADAFIPGGGRPATVNNRNWREFLGADGAPVCPLIVEGANLFLTPEARTELSKAGALIFKDSSANKCGVMCSSFEISSSMLLTEEEFLRIKPAFVEQVLEKLRRAARDEAVVLLGEARRHPSIPLPELSTRLSRAINSAADAIQPAVASWRASESALFREVVLEHIPRELSTTVGERIFTELPHAYLEWMVAKSVASRIVYREGIDFFASMESGAVAEIALNYLKKELELRGLVGEVRASALARGERIAQLLERAGIRAALLEID